jgi:hypothetical protein
MLFPPSHILCSHETKIGLFFFNFYNKFLDENCRAHKTSKTDSSPNKVKWWFPNRVRLFGVSVLLFLRYLSGPERTGNYNELTGVNPLPCVSVWKLEIRYWARTHLDGVSFEVRNLACIYAVSCMVFQPKKKPQGKFHVI